MFDAKARQSGNHESNLSYRKNTMATENSVNFYTDYDLSGNIKGVKHRYKHDVWMNVMNYDYDIVTKLKS